MRSRYSPFDRSLLFVVAWLPLFCLPLRGATQAAPQKWALLIGIDEYADRNNLNRLGGAAADARALARTLTDIADFPEDHVHLLVSDAEERRGEKTPARAAILHELATLADKVKPGDLVLVAYSGHGIELDDKPCLLPYDTDASGPAEMADTAIPVERFMERLRKVRAGTLLLIFDMCRSVPKKGSKDIVSANTLKERQAKAFKLGPESEGGDRPTVITLFACSQNQRSYEWGEKRRGYFSYFLDEGLRGKAADSEGTVRFDRLMQYIGDNVEKTVLREEDRTQTPFFEVQGPAGAETRFTMARNVVYAAPLALTQAKTEKVDTEASFRLRVSPSEAALTVDGEAISDNFARIDLGIERERSVKIAVTAPGFRSEERMVTLKRGLNTPVSFALESVGGDSSGGTPPRPTAAVRPAPANAGRATIGEFGATPEIAVGHPQLITASGALAVSRRLLGGEGEGIQATVNVTSRQNNAVRIVYRPLTLSEGGTYRVRFRARADAPRQVIVGCATADGRSIGYRAAFGLTTQWQDIEFTFTASGVSARANYAPVILLGDRRGTVWVSGVSVEATPSP